MGLSFSKEVPGADLRVLSLGAGVQSTVLALMASNGEIGPMPDCAIFADTHWEPKAVYDHLSWLGKQLNFPIYHVSAGNIKDNILKGENSTNNRYVSVPYFTEKGGLGRRQCTSEYKIQPIRKKIRDLVGLRKGQHAPKTMKVEQWIGISTDEIQRLRNARDKWVINRWPLIELKMSRNDCRIWWDKQGYNRDLPKSACIGCPFHTDAMWKDMKKNDPDSWASAVAVDKSLRDIKSRTKLDLNQYMHSSCKPLDQVNFNDNQFEFGFLQECEGMCGV